ncbi:hypothetical protein C4M97_00325 [Mycoplasmopsis pullorum]|uniref:hypothetical protein n=1 Tax=Mycoplasmopsis pullorum TaxID=48003 RepID=UPI00111A1EC4|nr:hypothetical protein [Mycoplasmopsis pullorum]TNK81791.1 hypothetical protein C4M94_03000 [Mycoplasmopsis pullorum]TNK82838.1 hypothetical protein C4M80_02175 [Mycoplasmopsis pullorum]TNK84373.1 hypothetical protein C4M92_03545 [Mycoplasmopsis pullorum]TNK85113.1 hypothetical protein C4M81_00365 [Mycoplasmopsis pullorum]TNK85264.1 hypothetical protein C4M85_03275 [Mycoplasmopsis pullorum]
MKNKSIFKNISKKIYIPCFAVLGVGVVLVSTVAYKLTHKYKPNFYNYKSYISQNNMKEISKTIDYKQFFEINDFTNAIVNNRTIGGIGSDFQVTSLIKKGFLKPLDFEKIFKLDYKINSKEELKQTLKSVYSPVVWKHLESYDHMLETDWRGEDLRDSNGEKIHLWEYFLPYYVQDATIVWNPTKIQNSFDSISDEELDTNLAGIDQFSGLNDSHSIFNILNTLKNKGVTNFSFTDALRDNLLYGSSFISTGEIDANKKPIITDEYFEGTVLGERDNQNESERYNLNWYYKNLIKDFSNLILDSTGHKVTNSNNINFTADGLELLTKIISPGNGEKQYQAGLLYNGDALDAYYSEDNFEDVPEGTIKYLKPSKNILLVDGVIMMKDLSKSTEEIFANTVSNVFYKNSGKIPNIMKKNGWNLNDSEAKRLEYQKAAIREYGAQVHLDFLENEINNSEFQDYGPELKESFLKQMKQDYSMIYSYENPFALSVLENDKYYQFAKSVFAIEEKNDLARYLSFIRISDNFESEELASKYSNLENFDFINYTPTNNFEYELIYNNYFVDTETYEVNTDAQTIYKIDFEKDQTNEHYEHKSIQPISDDLLSKVSNYYYNSTKS